MYEYIQGRIAELTPTYVVIDNGWQQPRRFL